MAQQGQVFPLAAQGRDGTRWAYRHRWLGAARGACSATVTPRSSRRSRPLERALEQLRREQGLVESPTLTEFVEVCLAQHEGEPETTAKLRWLLGKAVRVF